MEYCITFVIHMRNIITISLQRDAAQFIAQQVKKRRFPSTSAYIRHLLETEQEVITEQDVTHFDREARRAHQRGKTKKLRSLKELM